MPSIIFCGKVKLKSVKFVEYNPKKAELATLHCQHQRPLSGSQAQATAKTISISLGGVVPRETRRGGVCAARGPEREAASWRAHRRLVLAGISMSSLVCTDINHFLAGRAT